MADRFTIPNQTENNTWFLYYPDGQCCPDWAVTIAPAALIIGAWLLCLYMAEVKRDIGFAFFMLCVSVFAFSNSILSSVSATNGVVSVNLPLLMVFVSIYEVAMTFLLMRELNQRKNDGDEGY